MEGKDHRGTPILEYIQQIIKDQGCDSYGEMKRKADNREEWKSIYGLKPRRGGCNNNEK